MSNGNTRRPDAAALLGRQLSTPRSRVDRGTEDDAAPTSIVDLVRAALEGVADPVTESVPVTSAGAVPALNSADLLRAALGGSAGTINGQTE